MSRELLDLLKWMIKKQKQGFLLIVHLKNNTCRVYEVKRYILLYPLVIALRIIHFRDLKGFEILNLNVLETID